MYIKFQRSTFLWISHWFYTFFLSTVGNDILHFYRYSSACAKSITAWNNLFRDMQKHRCRSSASHSHTSKESLIKEEIILIGWAHFTEVVGRPKSKGHQDLPCAGRQRPLGLSAVNRLLWRLLSGWHLARSSMAKPPVHLRLFAFWALELLPHWACGTFLATNNVDLNCDYL